MAAMERALSVSYEELCELATLMRSHVGVVVKDRSYRLRTYKRCFVGSEAVRWLINNKLANSTEAAELLGNKLLELGFIHHVLYEHPFRNKFLFYRFRVDDAGAPSRSSSDGGHSSSADAGQQAGASSRCSPGGSQDMAATTAATTSAPSSASAGKARGLVGDQPLQYRAMVQAQLNTLNQKVSRLAHDHQVMREMQGMVVDEAGKLRQRMAGLVGDEETVSNCQEALQQQVRLLQRQLYALQAFATLALLLVLCLIFAPSDRMSTAALVTAVVASGSAVWYLSWANMQPGKPSAAPNVISTPFMQPGAANVQDEDSMAPAVGRHVSVDSCEKECMDDPGVAAMHLREQDQLNTLTTTSSGRIKQLAPTPADFRDNPDAPVLMRPSPVAVDLRMHPPYDTPATAGGLPRLPINSAEPIAFESDLFVGRFQFLLRGVASCDEVRFGSAKRQSWLVVQGKFKQELTLDNLVTGQEFSRPFQRLPAQWFVDRVLLGICRKVSPSMRVGPLNDHPYMLTPFIAAAQIMNVSREGEEPIPLEAKEDMQLWDPSLRGKDSSSRRKLFSSPKARAGRSFDTQHVWTMHFWQHFVDLSTYTLSLGVASYDLTQHLDGQPLQSFAKDLCSSGYLWNFEVCHEALLAALTSKQRAQSRRGTDILFDGEPDDSSDDDSVQNTAALG